MSVGFDRAVRERERTCLTLEDLRLNASEQITASDDFYATREDAHGAGRDALDQILLDYANSR